MGRSKEALLKAIDEKFIPDVRERLGNYWWVLEPLLEQWSEDTWPTILRMAGDIWRLRQLDGYVRQLAESLPYDNAETLWQEVEKILPGKDSRWKEVRDVLKQAKAEYDSDEFKAIWSWAPEGVRIDANSIREFRELPQEEQRAWKIGAKEHEKEHDRSQFGRFPCKTLQQCVEEARKKEYNPVTRIVADKPSPQDVKELHEFLAKEINRVFPVPAGTKYTLLGVDLGEAPAKIMCLRKDRAVLNECSGSTCPEFEECLWGSRTNK